MTTKQMVLFQDPTVFDFPSTRYQGSKNKLLGWIGESVKDLDFETALDAFGGTGSVGYLFKRMGKEVTYNDILKSNYYVGLALIENDNEVLTREDIDSVLRKRNYFEYPTLIQDTFHNIYYTDEENGWLDVVVTNISQIKNTYKKALAYYALFQACIIKRPYNLFHRKNLYIRTADVKRSFGNKTTWDTPFEIHFINFAEEANQFIFSNGKICKALNLDAMEVPGTYDLVYVDTPYVSAKGVGVDYLEFYHFLEGLTDYKNWGAEIDFKSKHRRIKHAKSPWVDKNRITDAFDKLFDYYKESILVVSYRTDGIPSEEKLIKLLKKHGKRILEVKRLDYKYALSINEDSKEALCIAA